MSTKMFADTKPTNNPPSSNNQSNKNPQKKSTSMFSMFGLAQKPSTELAINAELLLIMGDVHIPNRIDSIPNDVKELLNANKGKFSRILCTGDFGTIESYEYFKSFAREKIYCSLIAPEICYTNYIKKIYKLTNKINIISIMKIFIIFVK